MVEHLIELPGDEAPRVFESPWSFPPLVITVDGARYVAAPVMTTAQAQKPWRYVPL